MRRENLSRSLSRHPFVAALTRADADFLLSCVKNVRFSAGTSLFREGEPAGSLLLIRRGRVALQSHTPTRGPVTVESMGDGDVLGWSVLYPPHAWHIEGVALDETLVFAIDGQCLREKLDQDPAFAARFLRRLLFEVHQRLERARLQQLDVYKAELG